MESHRGFELVDAAQHLDHFIVIMAEADAGEVTDSNGNKIVNLDPTQPNGVTPESDEARKEEVLPPHAPDEYTPQNSTGLAVTIGHELGHAIYEPEPEGYDPVSPDTGKPLGGLNVQCNENPVRLDFGLPMRKHYGGWKIPKRLQ